MNRTEWRQLRYLARLCGVETAYHDVTGVRREASPEALLAVLRALGVALATPAEAGAAIRELRLQKARRACEPVTVVWGEAPLRLQLCLPPEQAESRVATSLSLEDGTVLSAALDLATLPRRRCLKVAEEEFVVKELVLPVKLPPGYHRLHLSLPGRVTETLVVSAPVKAYTYPEKIWGVFVPLYALHSERSWGAGDFTDLENLVGWVQGLGGQLVGTLPLLAAFLDVICEPSPYLPVSCLFWNEFYLDVTRIPELAHCPPARELLASPAVREELAAFRQRPLVAYRRVMALKRTILELLARCLEALPARRAALEQWLAAKPQARDYARFRAAVEQQHRLWPQWPAHLQAGHLTEGDYDPDAARYHLFVQWLTEEQLQSVAAKAKESPPGLYFDLPLGVHPAGYDTWRERALFVPGVATGAPPDPFFAAGQNWGFPPLHPERLREEGYRYFIAALRHQLRYAGALRLDHVMRLHRLFWIPAGFPAAQGVYVRYRAAEFYAILTLEAHRYQAVIVGEDLGTVPPYVRTAMARHGIGRMYILPFALTGTPRWPLNPVPAGALAALNTHDMPPFAAFWQQDGRARSTLPSFLAANNFLPEPTDAPAAILAGCLSWLAQSPAGCLLVNLEDLWGETAPQNVPGTTAYPNWQRKTRYPFEQFSRSPEVLEILQRVNLLRKEGD
ncbi:4-alpha-glucanotransferase [Thermodesulfitimonas autotrophica]|uniref:4-alpha-glucanotransferase n=1 Tax=Thermodesulfitimonas autotrophica TaxID=1894989 RepID=A0A3N5AWS6_9THEO|nr:4-alpha-glucanotransferase [Thermodesulfitimonas autotrophica]RPF49343.1 4-alpha-glucanotransferase [Thermodesulfitimonas autotrophica]